MPASDLHTLTSSALLAPVLDLRAHTTLVESATARAVSLGKRRVPIAAPSPALVNGVFTLARYQTPFKRQNDRGTCWAFAGVAALEAAYRRKFGTVLDMSEEYTFHMGKAFALSIDANGFARSIEDNSSLTGFQGSGDIVEKICENAIPGEETAPYLESQAALLGLLPMLGYPGGAPTLASQEDFDAIEFCEQHIPLIARVNARYRGTDWASIGANPSVADLENTLLAGHEVVCDVTHLTSPIGGHVLLLIGFDRNRRVFFAKNHWGENAFIEIQYANDPNWAITSGYYIEDVVDPTFVQSEACWLGNWWLTSGGQTSRLLLRRAEDFTTPKQPTKLGTLYAADGRHDVNGSFLDNGATLRMFVGAPNVKAKPGTLAGTRVDGQARFHRHLQSRRRRRLRASNRVEPVHDALRRHLGEHWRNAVPGASRTRRERVSTGVRSICDSAGFRPATVAGYSEGPGARFAGVWVPDDRRVAWEARHNLGRRLPDCLHQLAGQGYRLVDVSGYAIDGSARYAALWERRAGPDWQAHHGMNAAQFQQTLTALAAQSYVLTRVSGYRVGLRYKFAGIWEKGGGAEWQMLFGLTSSQYQKKFDELLGQNMRPVCVSGYSDSGIARFAAIWRASTPGTWQARHGLDAAHYQTTFDELSAQGLRPVQISGYGDGFYPA